VSPCVPDGPGEPVEPVDPGNPGRPVKKQVCVEPCPPALKKALPAFAAERGRLQQTSLDSWYAAPEGRSAVNQPHAAAAVD